MREYEDIHAAYLGTLRDVFYNYDFESSPRGQKVYEKLNYSFKITNPVSETIVTEDESRNEKIKSYTKKEYDLYESGTNRVEDFKTASSFWSKIANPDGTINSAYGNLIKHNKSHGNPMYELNDELKSVGADSAESILKHKSHEKMRTPWEWCVESLKKDKHTRQAVLRFSLPEHFYFGNKDMTCTLEGNFHIRDDKLYFSVHMRSNDLVLGLVYDMPWFVSLMDDMIEELRDDYPNLEKGYYVHKVDSIHVYNRDSDKIRKMIGEI